MRALQKMNWIIGMLQVVQAAFHARRSRETLAMPEGTTQLEKRLKSKNAVAPVPIIGTVGPRSDLGTEDTGASSLVAAIAPSPQKEQRAQAATRNAGAASSEDSASALPGGLCRAYLPGLSWGVQGRGP